MSNHDAERRASRRRDEDVAAQDVLETERSIFHALTRTRRIGTLVGSICIMVGIAIGAASAMATLPKEVKRTQTQLASLDSSTNRRVDHVQLDMDNIRSGHDSIRQSLVDIKAELSMQRYTQCIIARRIAPDIRPDGCDAAGKGGSPAPRP